MTRDEIFAALEQRRVAKVVLDFEGGNDSGSIERTRYFDEKEKEITDLDLITCSSLDRWSLQSKIQEAVGEKVVEEDKQLNALLENTRTGYLGDNAPSVFKYLVIADYLEVNYGTIPAVQELAEFIRKTAEPSVLLYYLEDPVYEEYGSFAGDFNVAGTLSWDVKENRVEMEGNEYFYEGKSFARSL